MGEARQRSWARPVALVVALVALGIVAAHGVVNAHRTIGRPFPSLFVDPYGCFSAVYLPAWLEGGSGQEPRFPDRLVAIDGRPLPHRIGYGSFPSQAIPDRLTAERVTLVFERGLDRLSVVRRVRTLGPVEVGFFFWLYAFAGAFALLSGVMVLALAGRRAGGRAYAFWAGGAFLFMVTFYDYHTTAALTPCFALSTVWVALGFCALAWAFPQPPRRHREATRIVFAGAAGLAALTAGWIILAPALGRDADGTRRLVGHAVPAACALLAAVLLARVRRSTGAEREELRSALWGLAFAPAVVGVGIAFGVGTIHLVGPFLLPLLPLSLGYALVRHNILGTTAVLARWMFAVPIALFALGVAALVGWAAAGVAARGGVALLAPITWGAASFVGVAALGHRLVTRWLFPAAAHFRPTIEQLADQLATLRERGAVRRSVEDVVARWLPTERVEVLDVARLPSVAHLPDDAGDALARGDRVWTDESPWQRALLVPMRSLGELRAVLLVAAKRHAALYTSEDLALLETIAGLGALALTTWT